MVGQGKTVWNGFIIELHWPTWGWWRVSGGVMLVRICSYSILFEL